MMYQAESLTQDILGHPVVGIILFFIGIFIFYKFIKLILKYTVIPKGKW